MTRLFLFLLPFPCVSPERKGTDMKYSYYYATGTESVEIDEEWAALLQAMDREEEANRKKETRRHYSLDDIDYEGEEFGAADPEIRFMSEATDKELVLLDALKKLNEKQSAVIRALYYAEKTGKEYAEECGIKPSAVTQQKNTAIKNLKKFFEEP